MRILEASSFRVTRSTDLDVDDDEAEDLLEALEDRLRRQSLQPGRAARGRTPDVADRCFGLLMRELQVAERDVHRLPAPLGLVDLWNAPRPRSARI